MAHMGFGYNQLRQNLILGKEAELLLDDDIYDVSDMTVQELDYYEYLISQSNTAVVLKTDGHGDWVFNKARHKWEKQRKGWGA